MGLQLQGSLQVTALLDAEVEAVMRKLDVAAALWERLLHKHALKTVARDKKFSSKG